MNLLQPAKHILMKCVKPQVVGMIHVKALPRTPLNSLCIDKITEKAVAEAKIYQKYRLDGIIVENMFDIPYTNPKEPLGPEVIAAMTRICSEISHKLPDAFKLKGVQILTARGEEALAVALASGFNFIRAEGFVFSHIGDEGFIDSCAGSLLRYRKSLGPQDKISVFTDIKKKHSSHSITSDVSLEDTAEAAKFFLSDGLILTGSATGQETSVDELKRLQKFRRDLPVLIGSGINCENMGNYKDADAWIIGSTFKTHGEWSGDVEEERVEQFMKSYDML